MPSITCRASSNLAFSARLIAIVASVGIGACTYDFDKFVVQPDARAGADTSTGAGGAMAGSGTQSSASGGTASANGGAAGATSMNGGAAGIAATGGQAGAGAGGAASGGRPGVDAGAGGSTESCSGAARGGICWYLGAPGSSCQQVCASHGQPAPEAASHVGTTSQGGSLTECGALLGLLGVNGAPTSGTRSDGIGLGCHVYSAVPWWLSAPNFSVSASHASAQLVCGCSQ